MYERMFNNLHKNAEILAKEMHIVKFCVLYCQIEVLITKFKMQQRKPFIYH